jgi:hypothetical protein
MKLESADVKTLRAVLEKCDNEDLNLVVRLLKARRDSIARMNTATLARGKTVRFTGRRGVTVTGTVEQINQKTVIVKATDGVKWRVAGSLLEVVK